MKSILVVFLLISGIIFCSCSKQNHESLIFEKLKPCNTADLDPTVLCGTYSVFENRQTNSGRKIDLKIVVIPATHRSSFKPPIFCLEGGPGMSVTTGASFYADSINYYRLQHDVVLIDVRGTGGSNPLHCRQLQYKSGLEEHFTEMYPTQNVKDCYDSLSKRADLTQYTTTNMAIDIEEVRKWLGYDKINLFGVSFGGRLAQAYMKMFSSSVESCVFWSPSTTSLRMPLYHAQYAEQSLNKLFEDCKSDSLCNVSFPNVKAEFNALMESGKQKSFEVKFKSESGEDRNLTIPWFVFQTKIRGMMYHPSGLRQIPYVIHESYSGNWKPFISLFPKASSYDDFIAEGLYLCITCTEDVPFFTKGEADSLSAGTFMGDYRVQQQMNACANWTKGTVPDNFLEPLTSDIPTLVLSGFFDPVTPPSLAEQIVQTLPNGHVVNIPRMSHTFDGLSSPECFDKMVVDFFDQPGTTPESDCIKQMLPDPYRTN